MEKKQNIFPPSSNHKSSTAPILIIGAGVLGLSTAYVLQTQTPNRRLVIIASELPTDDFPTPDYASPWAGAHYRPTPGSTPQLRSEAVLAKRTFEVMKQIAAEVPEAGVELMPGVEYLEDPPEANLELRSGEEYAGSGDKFRVLGKEELPEGVRWGCQYGTYCINVPVYCKWLLRRFLERGGKVMRRKLKNAESAFDVARQEGLGEDVTVVNCSGTNFGHDAALKIIRGQTVLVKQQYGKTVTRQNSDGSWAFLIPRPCGGGTIVGGSKEVGDMEEAPRAETREKLLRQAVKYFPDFVEGEDAFEILRDNVGRRPYRDGGCRLETEVIADGRRQIIHAYGIGGRGYETSWAIAERVVELLNMESRRVVAGVSSKL
jgi:D-amino-acid oxidase